MARVVDESRLSKPLRPIADAARSSYEMIVSASGGKIIKRPQQVDLNTDMAAVFDRGGVGIFESPTGTGKTLLMVNTAVVFAVTNKRQVVIATPQKNLQVQCIEEFHKWGKNSGDSLLGRGKVALLKGRRNYVSREALRWLVRKYKGNPVRYAAMKGFEAFVDQSGGDIDFIRGTSEVPDFLTDEDIEGLALSEAADPANDYYLTLAKEAAQDADVIVTNHFMLLTYMQQRMYGNPCPLPLDHLIIDEAHAFINSAYSFFSEAVALRTIRQQLKEYALHVGEERFRGAQALSKQVGEAVSVTSNICKAFETIGDKLKAAGRHELYINELRAGHADGKLLHDVESHTEKLFAVLKGINTGKYRDQFRGDMTKHVSSKLDDSVSQLRTFLECFNGGGTRHLNAYFIMSFSRERKYPSFSKVTPSVSAPLFQNLWREARTIIFTSGTLADFNSSYAPFTGTRQKATFQHFRSELGLNMLRRPFLEYAYRRPFSFKHVTLHLYSKAPLFGVSEDDETGHVREEVLGFSLEIIVKSLVRGKPVSEGGAMVLVPAHEDIVMLVDILEIGGHIPTRRVIAQAPSRTLQMCIAEFKQIPPGEGLLLLTGAWQGTDLPGKQLTDLFIPRIPRSNPQDAQVIARRNARRESIQRTINYQAANELAIGRYKDRANYLGLFTEDVWKFKQGCGRLCRKEGDEGHIHIMDGRLFNGGGFEHILAWIEKTFPNVIRH